MKMGAAGGSLDILSESDLERIHTTSLAILQDPGIRSESDLVIDIMRKGGAKVNDETRSVQVPEEMVAAALKSVTRSFVVHGRDPNLGLQIELGRVYYGMGGTSEPYIWDYETGKPRIPTKADMVANTRVAQALSNVDLVMSLCSARDMPTSQVFLHEYDAIFRNTNKPVMFSVVGQKQTGMILEMAAAACGGESELRKRPWVMAFVSPMSPMMFTGLNDGIFEAAALGVPIVYAVGPMMGATGPASLAGTLAQANAEVLFGLVLSQLIKPGIPFVHSPHTPAMDMVTAQCTYASAEQALARVAASQLARLYKLPSLHTGAGVEAKLPDAQAASEAMMGMLLNGLTGIPLTICMGTLASGLYGSVEMLVICDEIVRMVKRVLNGIRVDDETLALEVIREVGPGGQFLDHDHTALHFRDELFFPCFFRRQSITQWLESGAKAILDVAHEAVLEILSKEDLMSLPEGADRSLERVLQRAVCEIGKEESED